MSIVSIRRYIPQSQGHTMNRFNFQLDSMNIFNNYAFFMRAHTFITAAVWCYTFAYTKMDPQIYLLLYLLIYFI